MDIKMDDYDVLGEAEEKNKKRDLKRQIQLESLLLAENIEDYLLKALLLANSATLRCQLSSMIKKEKGKVFENMTAIEEWQHFLLNISK